MLGVTKIIRCAYKRGDLHFALVRPWLVDNENGYVKFQKVRIRKFSVCHRLSFADTEKLFRFRNKTVSIAYGSDFLLTYIFMGFLCPQYCNFQSY